MSTRASASLIRCFSLVISSNVDILHLRGRVLVDPDSRSFEYPGYSEHSGSPVSPAFGHQSRPLYSRYSGSSSRSRSHSPSIEVLRGRRQIRLPLLGRLGRAYSRPFLNLSLFAQKTVEFGLHCRDSYLLPPLLPVRRSARSASPEAQ